MKSSKKQKVDQSSFVPAKGSSPVKKHKLPDNDVSPAKKSKTTGPSSGPSSEMHAPLGLQWDGQNYSCSYDSLFTILFNIWQDDPLTWTGIFRNINSRLGTLAAGFEKVLNHNAAFEDIRNRIRYELNKSDSVRFPYGSHGASVSNLAMAMFKSNRILATSQCMCTSCDYSMPRANARTNFFLENNDLTQHSTAKWLQTLELETYQECPHCLSDMKHPIVYHTAPKILIFEYPDMNIRTSPTVTVTTTDGNRVVLNLRGIVYCGGFHFTSRIITKDKEVWYHDGRVTGQTCTYEGLLDFMTDIGLRHCQSRNLVLAIYAQGRGNR